MSASIRVLGLLLSLVLLSCEKKIFEIIPVLQVEHDLSIPEGKNIRFFTFPSEQTGYAADDSPYIFKTLDGGKSWSKIAVGAGGNCKGLEFFDNLNGMCLMGNSMYVTHNGGQSWAYKGTGNFIGKTEDGKGVVGSCDYTTCSISVSLNQGKSFQFFGNIQVNGEYSMSRVTGTKVFVVGDWLFSQKIIYGLDLKTGEKISLGVSGQVASEKPYDIYDDELLSIIVGNNGQILENYYSYSRSYYGHSYDYYSVDGYNDLAIAVGDRTISVNIDFNDNGSWSELLDVDGKSFKRTFYKIRFIDQNRFYISGDNGLLWVAKI